MSLRSFFSEIPFYPFLLAVMPAISVYANQPSQVMPGDLVLAVVVSLVGAMVIFGVAKYLFKDAKRSAFASLLVLFWIFSYGMGQFANAVLASIDLPMLPHRFWLLGSAAIMMVGLIWIYRREALPEDWSKGLNIFACCTALSPIFLLGSAMISSETAFRSSPPGDTPKLNDISLSVADHAPDIYYLVFDRYARADVLARDFGHDNEAFLNQLRDRGFFVADKSRANYPKTEYSMSSALNMSLHGSESAPKSHYMNWLAEHRVGRALKANGYAYYHLGNMLDGLRANPMAGENYRFSRFGCEFHDVMIELTAFHPLLAGVSHRDRALAKFERLPQIAQQKGRKFVYAHFLLPHEPWKFDREGNDPAESSEMKSNRERYIDQMIYTNNRIIETIDAIRKNSSKPPIIILQADEGPELKYAGDADLSQHARVDRRTAILSAFAFPDRNAASIVPPDVTPVNTFRIVFREYFGGDLPDEPNRVFYWSHPNRLGKPAVTRINKMVDWTDRLN